ncbi:MAG TPA: efflux RND transporter periplasmic adaptor subunit [Mucilaginibacter sp.]|jgi:HlyD family secretion protein
MKKTYKRALIILAIVIGIVIVWKVAFKKKEQLLVLPTEKPTYGNISQTVTATGRIQPLDTVTVGTQVSGVISVLNADFNSIVHKGELLAQLDKSLLQATVDQGKANLATQKSALEYNRSNFERQKLLYSTGSISKAEYETAQNSYNAAVAGVANIEAQLRSASKNLSYADIYSPIDGVVLSRNVSIGQTVAASFSTPTLFVLAKDITKMQVQADVDEADIGNIKKGERVIFTVDAYVDDNFKGTISDVRLHPKISSNVVTYTTVIFAPNDEMKLKPGMTANINIFTREAKHTLLITSKSLNFTPDSTVIKQFKVEPYQNKAEMLSADSAINDHHPDVRARTRYVWVKKGNTLAETPVKTGLDDNTHAQILSGVSEKDSLISSLPIPGMQAQGASIFPPPPGSQKKKPNNP